MSHASLRRIPHVRVNDLDLSGLTRERGQLNTHDRDGISGNSRWRAHTGQRGAPTDELPARFRQRRFYAAGTHKTLVHVLPSQELTHPACTAKSLLSLCIF